MTATALKRTALRFVDASGAVHRSTVGDADLPRLLRALPIRRSGSHRHQRHRPGLFWSATTGEHIPYESWLELDRLWLADADPGVAWIAAQPMAIEGLDDDRFRRHVPDFLLTRRQGPPLIVDVKPAAFAAVPEVAAVFDWTRRICAVRGWDYEVWCGADPGTLAHLRAAAWARRMGHPSLPPLVASNLPACRDLAAAWAGFDTASSTGEAL